MQIKMLSLEEDGRPKIEFQSRRNLKAVAETKALRKKLGKFLADHFDDNAGFLKFVIVDHNKRGTGYGKEMLKLALQYAFDITGVELVQLNVFDENVVAKHCYEKIGFIEESIAKNIFSYKDELWSRCHMIVTK